MAKKKPASFPARSAMGDFFMPDRQASRTYGTRSRHMPVTLLQLIHGLIPHPFMQPNPDELAELRRELAKLKRSAKKSKTERGNIWAIVFLAVLTVFALGFKSKDEGTGQRYSWDFDSSILLTALQIISGATAVPTGLMAVKNLFLERDDDKPEDEGTSDIAQ